MRFAAEPSFSGSCGDDGGASAEQHNTQATVNLERIRHGLGGCETLQGVAGRNRTVCRVICNMLAVARCGVATPNLQYCRRALSATCSWPTDRWL